MNRVLFMTVGTGVGVSKDRVHSLAHGLKESIKHTKPDAIVFFGSSLSKKTIESLKNQYMEEGYDEFLENKFVLIENVDSFDDCFSAMKNSLEDYKDEEVIIDYTSGTKTMTMTAAICSVLYHKDLILITGSRGINGLVTSRTENIVTQNLYKVYDELLFDEFKKFFNHFKFIAAIKTLQKIVALKDKEAYMKLTMAYRAWDLFNHEEAKKLLSSAEIKELKTIKKALGLNKNILGIICDPKNDKKNPYIIADLLNNARRRGTEQKYDDAVARLYRTVELIAQCTLKEKHDIDTSNIEIDKLNPFIKAQMQFKEGNSGKITCGLQQSYQLLRLYDEEIGKRFSNDSKLKGLLKRRNYSILAHGLKPIKKADYEELLDKTIELAVSVYPEVDLLMKKAEFPQL
ncbi:MAG: TIGR02710 family CRISPR-associated CARF protein [Methanobacterium sp.]|jgi:CRISPR-associated protein (TIGR02710 family)